MAPRQIPPPLPLPVVSIRINDDEFQEVLSVWYRATLLGMCLGSLALAGFVVGLDVHNKYDSYLRAKESMEESEEMIRRINKIIERAPMDPEFIPLYEKLDQLEKKRKTAALSMAKFTRRGK